MPIGKEEPTERALAKLGQVWLDCHTSKRIDFREYPSVRTKRRVRRYLPVVGCRTYRVYRQLCLAKHSNPLLQQDHGHYVNEEAVFAPAS